MGASMMCGRGRTVGLVAALGAVATTPPPASGALFTVNTTVDSVDVAPGDGVAEDSHGATSLRAAIMESNALAGADTIHLPAGVYTLDIAGPDVEDLAESGDLDVTGSLRVVGAGAAASVVDGARIDRVFDVRLTGDLTLQDLGVRNGEPAHGGGGGLRTNGPLQLTRVSVVGNTAGELGGGVMVDALGRLEAADSEFALNSSDDLGGGIGMVSSLDHLGVVMLDRCLVRDNRSGASGGGIGVRYGWLVMVNTTISGNSATFWGGGVSVNLNVFGRLTHCTVVDNVADKTGAGSSYGGGFVEASGLLTLRSCIVAENRTPSSDPQNGAGKIESLGHNLFDDVVGFTRFGFPGLDLEVPDVMVGPLADHGGPTLTHALEPGSPAIDAADPASDTWIDQRVSPRPQDADGDWDFVADIGAFEVQAPLPECVGDTTGDGVTDVFDFADLADNFGAGPGATRAMGDVNHNGFVDVFDFADLADDFGCVPGP
jgi:hypothetical protein